MGFPRRGKAATLEGRKKRLEALKASGAPPNNTVAGRKAANPNRLLTEKQRLFVKHWAEGSSVSEAAFKAGYADGGAFAHTMKHDPAIIKLYNQLTAKFEKAGEMSRKKVMEGLKRAAELAESREEAANMVSAWRQIGLLCGYYEPTRVEVDVNVRGNVILERLNRLSDAELLKIIDVEPEPGPESE